MEHTSEFLFGIYWWTWKTTIYYKKLLKWVNKKCENFNIYNVAFFLKNKEKHLRYHCFTPAYQKSWWYDLQFLRYRVSQTEIGNYVPITPPLLKTWKIRILKKWKKNSWIYHHFTHVHQKLQSFEVWFLRYRMKWDRQKFLSFWAIFCPFTPPPTTTTWKIKILKKWKNTWWYHFTQV